MKNELDYSDLCTIRDVLKKRQLEIRAQNRAKSQDESAEFTMDDFAENLDAPLYKVEKQISLLMEVVHLAGSLDRTRRKKNAP